MCPNYILKINSIVKKQIIVLIIPSEEREGCYYLAVKKLSALLRIIASKHHDDFYCLKFLHSFATENKLESYEKVCKKTIFVGLLFQFKRINVLELNQYMKSDKMSYII